MPLHRVPTLGPAPTVQWHPTKHLIAYCGQSKAYEEGPRAQEEPPGRLTAEQRTPVQESPLRLVVVDLTEGVREKSGSRVEVGSTPLLALGVTGTTVAVLALRVRARTAGKRDVAGGAFADTFRVACVRVTFGDGGGTKDCRGAGVKILLSMAPASSAYATTRENWDVCACWWTRRARRSLSIARNCSRNGDRPSSKDSF